MRPAKLVRSPRNRSVGRFRLFRPDRKDRGCPSGFWSLFDLLRPVRPETAFVHPSPGPALFHASATGPDPLPYRIARRSRPAPPLPKPPPAAATAHPPPTADLTLPEAARGRRCDRVRRPPQPPRRAHPAGIIDKRSPEKHDMREKIVSLPRTIMRVGLTLFRFSPAACCHSRIYRKLFRTLIL